MRLPIFQTIRNGVVLAARVGRRHWRVVIGFALGYAIIPSASLLPIGGLSWIVAIIQVVVLGAGSFTLAILVHREILVGPTPVPSLISRPALGRLMWYAIDFVTIVGMMFVLILLETAITIPVAQQFRSFEPQFVVFALILLPGLVASRLSLKLPARAIDEPVTWSRIWAIGRGNTLRLFVVMLLPGLLLSELMITVVAQAALIIALLLYGFLTVGLAVLTTAWLSVCYLYLTVGGETVSAEADEQPER